MLICPNSGDVAHSAGLGVELVAIGFGDALVVEDLHDGLLDQGAVHVVVALLLVVLAAGLDDGLHQLIGGLGGGDSRFLLLGRAAGA